MQNYERKANAPNENKKKINQKINLKTGRNSASYTPAHQELTNKSACR